MVLNDLLQHVCNVLRIWIHLNGALKLGCYLRILLPHALQLGQRENLLNHGMILWLLVLLRLLAIIGSSGDPLVFLENQQPIAF